MQFQSGGRPITYDPQRSLELLRLGSGLMDANFREGQEEAIRHIVEGRGRLLVVEKTGWGKSFVYFIAIKLLREAGHGPALLISPLLVLMRNQISAARRMNVRAAAINSDNQVQWDEIESQLEGDEIDILLISPERLANERFRTEALARIAERISLLVVDEAHCISDWGHDFRPDYRLLERTARTLPLNMRLLATTATANNRVMDDLKAVLGPNLRVSRGDLSRPSLTLKTIRMPSRAERLAWLAQRLCELPGHGIIYTLTVRDANTVAGFLQSGGLNVEAYTSQAGARREMLEEALAENRVKALVATVALGMGYDKPDLAFVIHYQTPGSVVAYYQQVGRAGRAIPAYGVLLSGEEDTEITEYFIKNSFPTREEVTQLIHALEAAPEGLSIPEMQSRVNMSMGRIRQTVNMLGLESPAPIVKQKAKYQLTSALLSESFWARADRLSALRRAEQREMQRYVALASGHMKFLVQALDGDPDSVTAPDLPPLPDTADPELIEEAIRFLRRTSLPIEPRERWPAGGMPIFRLRGAIPSEQRARPGKALCRWGDASWGGLVRTGKYQHGHFANDLVAACAEMLREWAPRPSPAWVTCVPSLRHPQLVPDFAHRLALALGLPFHIVLKKTDDRSEQKTMANSIQQARNLDGSLAVEGHVPHGNVLLVDDMVDSRWTITVAAWLLRLNGSGEVWPLTLAHAGHI
ncbi:MAG: RecQ family ATP-dependent DNA helicase [Acidobacteriaceae bacterium]